MLLIDNEIVAKVVSAGDCIEIQEEAFGDLRDRPGHPSAQDRHLCAVQPGGRLLPLELDGGRDGAAGAVSGDAGQIGHRLLAEDIRWPLDRKEVLRRAGPLLRADHCCSAPKPAGPLAMINDGTLQHIRVGAGAGLGAKYLSRPDSKVVGLLGAGGMAKAYLQAFMTVTTYRAGARVQPDRGQSDGFCEGRCRANSASRSSRSQAPRPRCGRRHRGVLHRQHGADDHGPNGSRPECM